MSNQLRKYVIPAVLGLGLPLIAEVSGLSRSYMIYELSNQRTEYVNVATNPRKYSMTEENAMEKLIQFDSTIPQKVMTGRIVIDLAASLIGIGAACNSRVKNKSEGSAG